MSAASPPIGASSSSTPCAAAEPPSPAAAQQHDIKQALNDMNINSNTNANKKKKKKKKHKKKHDGDADDTASDVDCDESLPPVPLSEDDVDESVKAVWRVNEQTASDPEPAAKASAQLPITSERWGGWGPVDWRVMKIRGATYLYDKIKIEPVVPPVFTLIHCEIWHVDNQPIYHVCKLKDNWLNRKKNKTCSNSSTTDRPSTPPHQPAPAKSFFSVFNPFSSSSATPPPVDDCSDGSGLRPHDPDFWFVLHFIVSYNPTYHLICYYQKTEHVRKTSFQKQEEEKAEREAQRSSSSSSSSSSSTLTASPAAQAHDVKKANAAFNRLFQRFVTGTNEFRNNHLKMLTHVVDGGNWIVTKTVGNRPTIIGNKITTTYYADADKNYLEADIDVTSSRIGSSIFKVVKGYASSLTIDMVLLIEGQADDELPEVILGGVRLDKIRMVDTFERKEHDERTKKKANETQ